ncbi:MAG: cytidylyltransferase domain-containing protein [Omnitrophica WOR_2 bacterium]
MPGKPKVLVIIQARMSSSRLPGKVLLDIGGQPMLARVVERARRAKTIDGVVVATTTDPADDGVAAFCARRGYDCYRGSLHDVLDRFYQAASTFGADVIVRLTGDCPVIDPSLIDEAVYAFFGSHEISSQAWTAGFPYDFVANRLPPPWRRTYPIGLDTEVCSFRVLQRAWKEAALPHQREHVMPYLYEQEGRFRVLVLNHDPDYGDLRWTVDTPEDLEVIRRLYAHFGGRDDFSWLEVLDLFEHNPQLVQMNRQVHHKDYREVDSQRNA